ncbi:MAG: hypothetical protein IT446_06770 [Phycisphaerales bacterium]|nr:hypothetical protein [Phycisphaerales bacterium]
MMFAAVQSFDFTPKPGLILQGHLSDVKSSEVLLPLEGRVLALRRGDEPPVVVATLDVIGVSLEFNDRVREEARRRSGSPGLQLLIATSHTHGAPATLPAIGMTPDADYVGTLESRLLEAIVRAVKGCDVPVRFAVGSSETYFHTNRRPIPGAGGGCVNRGGVFDPRVRTLRLDRADGSTLASLFCFSCHPTSIAGSTGKISSDYPGAARRVIEEKTGAPALFMPGCFGNIRPAYIQGEGFRNATVEELMHSGELLAGAVERATLGQTAMQADRLSFHAADLKLEYMQSDPDAIWKELSNSLPNFALPAYQRWHDRVKGQLQAGGYAPAMSRMQAVAIGPVLLMTIPGESVQEIGYAIERAAEDRGINGVWALGYCTDMTGYLVTQRHKAEGGYEPNAYPHFDAPAPFVNEEEAIQRTAEKLLESFAQTLRTA